MKVLVIGADGFIGRNVVRALTEAGHEVHSAGHALPNDKNTYTLNLLDPDNIAAVLAKAQPEVIVNNAGIVANDETAQANVVMSRNLLEAVTANSIALRRVILSGSAGEYGVVDSLPVPETAPLRADTPYAQSKVAEEKVALEYRDKGVPVIVVRIFNPIGPGMKDRFMIPRLLRDMQAIMRGERSNVEVTRLDSRRDYIDVRDLANGILALVEGKPREFAYNIGSGVSTSNAQLAEFVAREIGFGAPLHIIETSDQPEQSYASQADISRMQEEFGWRPHINIEQTVKDIVHGSGR